MSIYAYWTEKDPVKAVKRAELFEENRLVCGVFEQSADKVCHALEKISDWGVLTKTHVDVLERVL